MTTLMRWTPPDVFRSRMTRLFDESFNHFLSPVTSAEELGGKWVPPVDIRETDDELTLLAEVPGLGKDDVNVTLENNVLTLSGERRFEKDADKEGYHRIERSYGSFTRSFTLPANVQTDQVKASFEQGVLSITLPKREEAKPRKIDIG